MRNGVKLTIPFEAERLLRDMENKPSLEGDLNLTVYVVDEYEPDFDDDEEESRFTAPHAGDIGLLLTDEDGKELIRLRLDGIQAKRLVEAVQYLQGGALPTADY